LAVVHRAGWGQGAPRRDTLATAPGRLSPRHADTGGGFVDPQKTRSRQGAPYPHPTLRSANLSFVARALIVVTGILYLALGLSVRNIMSG